ncbi:MAG: LamG domain-containing protein [Bacteroidales bacterium]|nr:LamG domain-containing protein [Bacteroidales bacterium]
MKHIFLFILCFCMLADFTARGQAELLVHYKFNEDSGSIAADASGNENYGVLNNNGNWVEGRFNRALEFAESLKVTIPYLAMTSESGSVSMWILCKPPTPNNLISTLFWAGIPKTSDGTYGNGFGNHHEMHMHIEGYVNNIWDGGELSFWANGENGGDPDFADGDSTVHLFSDPDKGIYAGNPPVNSILVNDSIWHHVVSTWDGMYNTACLYIDGSLVMQKDYWPGLGYDLTDMFLGQMGAGNRIYNGLMDDVRIYSDPLTLDEVVDLYNYIEPLEQCTYTIWVTDTFTTEIFDTTYVTVYDTVYVPDTLDIDVTIAGASPPNNTNTIKIYSNSGNDIIYINSGTNYLQMSNYSIQIVNSSEQEIFTSLFNQPIFDIDVDEFLDTGRFFIYILNESSAIIETRKLILE